jgi:hypothetical protein
MPIAGTNIHLDPTEGMDKISETTKVTTPYFSDGTTELLGAKIVTSSLTATNEKYYFGVSNSSTVTTEEFNITFGSTNGYGANVESNTKSETEAIYKQYASLLLAPTEVTGGFFISSPGSTSAIASGKDSEVFVLTSRRTNMKDRLNKGNWTIVLSGSVSGAPGGAPGTSGLSLTDDSTNDSPTATPAGDRYNIVSGALGTVAVESTVTNYGFFYPDVGIMVFSQQELSASMPGAHAAIAQAITHGTASTAGFGFTGATNADQSQALRFVNALHSGSLSFRDEEDQVSAQYFCRIKAAHCNFSNNPTFVSGSQNKLRHSKMRDNPQTFISSVQLYNDSGHMVAVGNLSTPLKKNFQSEATIKVKLTY